MKAGDSKIKYILIGILVLAVLGFIFWKLYRGIPERKEAPRRVVTPQELHDILEEKNPPKTTLTPAEEKNLQKLQQSLPPPPKSEEPTAEAKKLLDLLNPPKE